MNFPNYRKTFLEHISPEIQSRVAPGQPEIGLEEYKNMRMNSWERMEVEPHLTDEAFIWSLRNSLKNTSVQPDPFHPPSTYDRYILAHGIYELETRFTRLQRHIQQLEATLIHIQSWLTYWAEYVNNDMSRSIPEILHMITQATERTASEDPELALLQRLAAKYPHDINTLLYGNNTPISAQYAHDPDTVATALNPATPTQSPLGFLNQSRKARNLPIIRVTRTLAPDRNYRITFRLMVTKP